MQKPVLVVMAAGMGSRYGGLKQLDPVGPGGQLIIDYSLFDAHRAGFETVIFVIKPEIEAAFRAGIGDRISKVMQVHYVFQRPDDLPQGYTVPVGREKPWGTAQAALAARELVDGPFAVINSDDYYGPHGFQEIYNYLIRHPDRDDCYEYAMVGYLLQNTVTEHGHVARGVCQETEDGYLHSVVERTRIVRAKPAPGTPLPGRSLGQISRFPGSGFADGSSESRVLPAHCGQPAPGQRKGAGENSAKPRQVVWRHLPGG